MPDLPLSLIGGNETWGSWGGFGGSTSGGWGDILRGGLDVIRSVLQQGGGAGLQLPPGTDVDLPGYDIYPGDPMSRGMWRQTASGYSQVSTLIVPSPTGKLGFWKAQGRPILFSGDLAAARRVSRVASRAARHARRRGGR
jgi:hypothetical protein